MTPKAIRVSVSSHDQGRLSAVAGPVFGVKPATLGRILVHWGLDHIKEVQQRLGVAGAEKIQSYDEENPGGLLDESDSEDQD